MLSQVPLQSSHNRTSQRRPDSTPKWHNTRLVHIPYPTLAVLIVPQPLHDFGLAFHLHQHHTTSHIWRRLALALVKLLAQRCTAEGKGTGVDVLLQFLEMSGPDGNAFVQAIWHVRDRDEVFVHFERASD